MKILIPWIIIGALAPLVTYLGCRWWEKRHPLALLLWLLILPALAHAQSPTSYTLKSGNSTLTVRTDGHYAYTKGSPQFFGQVNVEAQGDLLLFGEDVPGTKVFGHVNTATGEMSFRVNLAGVEVTTGYCELYKQMVRDLDYQKPRRFDRQFALSSAAFAGSCVFDFKSSDGLHEKNSFIANSAGHVSGAKFTAVNLALYGATISIQWKWPRAGNTLRYILSAVHFGVGVRNEAVKR